MAFRQPSGGYSFPDEFIGPPVMGIGDSMYNGMRSATINADFAARSVPAIVSRVVDADYRFRTPRYPEVLLLDVEQTLREIDLGDLTSRLRHRLVAALDNARRWGTGKHDVPAKDAAWDNIAQSGAVIDDVIKRDCAHWDARVADILPKLDGVDSVEELTASGVDIIELHMALNGRFLLNPNARSELKRMRPIDLVALRRPKILLCNLGSNHGIIDITLDGSEGKSPLPAGKGLRGLALWAEGMREVAELLTALPKDTRHIYVNTVPLPSTVPNLMYPYNASKIFASKLRRIAGYFPVYDNRLAGPGEYTQYSAQQMKAIDQAVDDINARMMQNMRAVFKARGDDRLRFFRLDEALKGVDGKHVDSKSVREGKPGVRLEHPRRAYSNKAIDFDNLFIFDAFREGGLASLDNHHPSGLGYAVLARELLRTMRADLPDINLNKAMISEMGDRLFSDPPGEYASLIRILYRLRRRRAGFPAEPDLAEANGPSRGSGDIPVALDAEEREVQSFVRFMGSVLQRRK